MQIDWFTFAAQIINFLILVWLLKRFLYKPVLEAMERRKSTIAKQFKVAEEAGQKAAEEQKKFVAMQEDFKKSVAKELQDVRQEAEKLRESLLDEVRQDAENARNQWHLTVEKEKKAFLDETSRTLSNQLQQLSRATLRDLAGEPLEKRIIKTFVRKLDQEKDTLRALHDAADADKTVAVSSAFALDDDLQSELEKQVQSLLDLDVTFVYQKDSGLIAGISLEAGGRKVRWDIDRYLDDFEKELTKTLNTLQAKTISESNQHA